MQLLDAVYQLQSLETMRVLFWSPMEVEYNTKRYCYFYFLFHLHCEHPKNLHCISHSSYYSEEQDFSQQNGVVEADEEPRRTVCIINKR